MTNFNEKTVWITGASSGIGAGLARQFAKQGAHLILSGRRADALAVVKRECGAFGSGDVTILTFETTDYDSLTRVVEDAIAFKGRIDCLVNNAGISQRSLALDTGMDVYRKILDVDFFAPVTLTKLVLPGMIKNGGGLICVTTSVAGKVGSKMRSGYCAAKHALHGFFDSLRAELYDDNIRVSLIVPGYVQTNVTINAITADGSPNQKSEAEHAKGISPDAAATRIVSALAKGKEEIYIGSGAEMLAVPLKRFFPGALSRMTRKQDIEGMV